MVHSVCLLSVVPTVATAWYCLALRALGPFILFLQQQQLGNAWQAPQMRLASYHHGLFLLSWEYFFCFLLVPVIVIENGALMLHG